MSASTAHDAQHERLLHEALEAGEGPVPDALADCPACCEALEELRDVSRLLDATAREERETLAALDWSAPAPGAELVDPFLRARLDERARRPLVRGRALVLRYAAAAAAVLSVGWLARELVAPEPGGGVRVLLGEEGFSRMGPAGEVDAFGAFTWSFRDNPDGWFEVQVAGADGLPRAGSGQLTEPRWEPTAAELASLPDEIRWTVTAFDASGASIGSTVVVARRR